MQCGNDVLEYSTHVDPVPEPGTMLLLSVGLIGAGAIARRKQEHQPRLE